MDAEIINDKIHKSLKDNPKMNFKKDFNELRNLKYDTGTIILTSDNYSANAIASIKEKHEEQGLHIYALSKYGVIFQEDINDLLDAIAHNRLNNGADDTGLNQSAYKYRPKFLIAVNDFEDDQTTGRYIYRQMISLGFDVDEVNLHNEYLTVDNFAKKDKVAFEQQLLETVENPENNFNNFLETVAQNDKSAISSGIPPIDILLDGGFYEGLYVLGAGSGMGKTSLALQMADYIAAHNNNVLYFALEMPPEELIAKSISRLTWLEDLGKSYESYKVLPTARNILLGDWRNRFNNSDLLQKINKALNYYKNFTSHMIIPRSSLNRPTASEIVKKVEEYIVNTNKKPVVFIDYLQLLRSENDRLTDKQNVTDAVNILKRLSDAYHIPIIVISSFNRNNYNRLDVDLDAYKESGDIEYTANVILALENDLSYTEVEYNNKNITLREAVENSKVKEWDETRASKYIRKLDDRPLKLAILKNRFGAIQDYVPLKFMSTYSAFGFSSYDGKQELFMQDPLEGSDQKNWLEYFDKHKKILLDNYHKASADNLDN